jgi:hypothetical protein
MLHASASTLRCDAWYSATAAAEPMRASVFRPRLLSLLLLLLLLLLLRLLARTVGGGATYL